MKRYVFAAKVCIGAALFFLVCGSAFAEDAAAREYDLGNVIVSATKTETYQAEIGSSTTIVTAEEIQKTQKRTVRDVLRDVPGVIVSQTGAFGGQTSIYLRGAKPGQTLVMIDGIEVNDPIDGSRAFDFAHLTTDNIECIEVVRGPQSPLYGSDAMAGVINIITKKGKDKPKVEGYVEGGSHNTFRGNLDLSGSIDKLDYSLSATCLNSDGISSAAGGMENDPYHNTTISSRIGYKILDNAELSLVAYYTDARKSIDDFTSQTFDMSNYTSWSKDLATKFAFDQSINSWWTHIFSFSYHDIRRKDKKEWDPELAYNLNDWYKGSNKQVEWQHNFSPMKWNILTAGFEYENETGSSYYYSDQYGPSASKQDRKSVDDYGYYFQDQLKLWETLFIIPGVRIDDYKLFGTKTTYKISTAYLIPQMGTRLKGNWGTAFKAPSLYQLYSNYGDPGMRPEESKSYDFGFEQSFFKDKVSFDVTYFHNDFKNMIDYDSAASKYKNIGKAITKGFETGVKFRPLESITIGANFTYTYTNDKETGLELLRRPKRQTNLDVNWSFLPNANLNLGLNYVGSRKDAMYDALWNQTIITDKAYTTVRLAASYDITKNFQIFGRIENLFDKEYQEVYGFETLGRSFYGGIKGNF